jgi:DNA-binding transcriptional regulator GbsR (MarR family)
MSRSGGELSCTAKLARVVLANRGPLSPSELAEEARISTAEAGAALAELADADLAESVCGMPATREEVYELTEQAAPGRA